MLSLNRRQALQVGLATTALVPAAAAGGTATNNTPWIDAHSHIWTPDTSQFALQPGISKADMAPASFDDGELMAVAQPHGVGRVVLIQHTVFHGFDNSYLIDAWRRFPDRFRVVGMIDDLRPHCGRAMREMLHRGVTGFRIAPRAGITDWLATAGMQDMWQTAASTRQSMCCLIDAKHLPAVDAMCARHPDTPVVIDHFARIGIDGIIRERDVDQLCRLARHPHTRVKISAYYALGKKRAPHIELIPMIRRLYDTFGAARLMWASDCPYQLSEYNDYESSIALVRDQLDFIDESARRQLLQTTAEETFFFT